MNYSSSLFKSFLTISLAVGFMPNFGAIDKIAPQWLFLNLIGLVFLLIQLLNKSIDFNEILANDIFRLLGIFLFWIAGSYFYAINPIESLVVFSQYFSWILVFILFYFSLKSIVSPFYFISSLLSLYLFIEILLVLYPLISSDLAEGIQYRSNLYLGTASNINITAFSILYKIPFLVYFLYRSKMKAFLKLIIGLLIISSSFFIINTLLLTRSAIITTIFLSIIFILTGIYLRLIKKIAARFSLIFILSLLFSYGLNSFISTVYGTELSSSARIQTIVENFSEDPTKKDGSISQRLNFYTQAIDQIKENPIIGVGIGNWKIKSIDSDKDNIIGYRVPYHVHNDFLELATEIGLIGMTIYVLIIIFSIFPILKLLIKNFTIQFNDNEFVKAICILVFFSAFLIDSMLNFPIARPIEIIIFILTVSYISLSKDQEISY